MIHKKSVYVFLIFLFTIICSDVTADEICDAVCAREAKPYAHLANLVYSDGAEGNGWELVRYDDGKIVKFDWFNGCNNFVFDQLGYLQCGTSGFYAALYKNSETQEYALAFRGTHILSAADWAVNVMQFLGWTDYISFDDQYDKAVAVAKYVKDLLPDGEEFVVVGHSLGGGLASWAALKAASGPSIDSAYFSKAYIFNAARINSMSGSFLYNYDVNIKSYISVNYSTGGWTDPISAFGSTPNNTTDYLVSVPPGHHGIYLHSIELMCEALKELADDGDSPSYPPKPTNPQALQENNLSSPGGTPIIQKVWGLTPGGTATLKVFYIEKNTSYTISINADNNGYWEDSYTPSTVKPIGTYRWFVTDDTAGKNTNDLKYKIIDPNSETPWYGNEGTEIVDNAPADCLPDFVAKRAWITKSENGNDKYVFEVGDSAWINVKVANEGCENSPQDISVWYFLSKGEKEDGHHDWVKIGDDTIRQDDLLKNMDKGEKEEFTVPNEPGTYNIVACADRIAQYDNGDGDVLEEHKSNDCSTEAVFTVLPVNHQPTGSITASNSDTVIGWAKDIDTPGSTFVNAYQMDTCGNKKLLQAMIANNTLPVSGGDYGFAFSLPDKLKSGFPVTLQFEALDHVGGLSTQLQSGIGGSSTVQVSCEPIRGNVNNNVSAGIDDTILALQVLVGQEPSETIRNKAEVSRGYWSSRRIGMEEAIFSLQNAAGLLDTWKPLKSPCFCGNREMLHFSLEGYGYIGVTSPGNNCCEDSQFWRYDPINNIWERKADLPDNYICDETSCFYAYFQAPSFVINGKAYVIMANQVWEYNPTTNQWVRKNDIPGEDKRAAFAFAIGNKAYVGGGFYNGFNLWEYDSITAQWRQKNDHPDLTTYGGGPNYPTGDVNFIINGKGYITGTNLYTWEYVPENDSWERLPYISTAYCGAFSINGKGYVFNTYGELFELNPSTRQWKKYSNFPGQTVCYPVSFSINGKGYIGLSAIYEDNTCTLDYINDFWEFTPVQ
ncbi:MAG: hypothetical protein U9R17_03540 [Thermodesulfobacteriota bacterium]|nr:hypothetical protein [Thermodesulfobacteriota bacterium]